MDPVDKHYPKHRDHRFLFSAISRGPFDSASIPSQTRRHPSSTTGNTYNPDAATPSSSPAGGRCSSQQLQNCSWRLLFSLQDQVSLPIAITRHTAHYRNDVASSHPYRQKAHKGVQATPVGPIPRCQGELEKAQGYRQQSAWSFVRLAMAWHGVARMGLVWDRTGGRSRPGLQCQGGLCWKVRIGEIRTEEIDGWSRVDEGKRMIACHRPPLPSPLLPTLPHTPPPTNPRFVVVSRAKPPCPRSVTVQTPRPSTSSLPATRSSSSETFPTSSCS